MNDTQVTAGRQRPASIGREHRPALVACLTAGFVTAAIAAVALILTLTDRHRAALVHADQGDHWHHEH